MLCVFSAIAIAADGLTNRCCLGLLSYGIEVNLALAYGILLTPCVMFDCIPALRSIVSVPSCVTTRCWFC